MNKAICFVLTLSHPSDASLRTARQTIGDGRPACMGSPTQPQNNVFKKRKQANACQLLNNIALS
ncbi:hypothetical protein [Rhizobium glycinendophyticum]|uniref:Uncharacterized protein n=1 Tax=Rhizobium glycinendophyticum TaxID=2589807 RepID=A0A504TQR3_9HYPH|nr:hypothetical protein [Rhizobium glycinendophyticum]TPP03690.1 hypothetical protein FJQ55_23250 [Rhizobium glycinendophyticum]